LGRRSGLRRRRAKREGQDGPSHKIAFGDFGRCREAATIRSEAKDERRSREQSPPPVAMSGLARRRPLAQKNGAALCAAFCEFADARRYELGVEAICQLATDVVALSMKNRDAEAPAALIARYWGIIHAASARPLPLAHNAVSTGMLVWMCLTQAIRWAKNLVRVHSKGRWEEVQETIVAWQDARGNDARAKYAQARFTTLTGIVRGAAEEHDAYLHAALIKALSDVQA
jgi:hypothetical protein